MDIDIEEIQSKWIPKIGDRVYIKSIVKKDYNKKMLITKKNHKDGTYKIRALKEYLIVDFIQRKDLIFIPSIEWFLEQMGMKTGNKLLSLFERFNHDSEYKYWMTTLSMPNKECICRIFMYYKGKIYKNGEWIDGIKDSLKLCPKCCLDIKKCECSNKEKF